MNFVSRAGEKLAFALHTFHISPNGLICADFGSSTGGFVDCLLQEGAQKVYSIDTSYGELAWKLRNNPRVVVMERTNAMHVELPEKMDIITNDTSWTKQEKVIPNIIKNLKDNGIIITLIKPHYQADKSLLKKGVLDENLAESISKNVASHLENTFPIKLLDFTKSPLLGGKGGNSEYIAVFRKDAN
ncbi:MAG TPA: SAM-dependent methyltransferase [Patescibacteria group bacterium]|nr:SAM-dependent methyltransferase [Patescibacteria group bacterium]